MKEAESSVPPDTAMKGAKDPRIESARASLQRLRATKNVRPLSQIELAQSLRRTIAALKNEGFTLAEISEHLKSDKGIVISVHSLAAAVRQRREKSAPQETPKVTQA